MCDGMFRELAMEGKCLVISTVQCKMEQAPPVLLGRLWGSVGGGGLLVRLGLGQHCNEN